MGDENEDGGYQRQNTICIPVQCTERLIVESYSEHTTQMCYRNNALRKGNQQQKVSKNYMIVKGMLI